MMTTGGQKSKSRGSPIFFLQDIPGKIDASFYVFLVGIIFMFTNFHLA